MEALHITLSKRLPSLKAALVEAGYPNREVDELMRLLAGIFVVENLAKGGINLDRAKVNKVLSAQIANGYSWYAAIKYLSGKRAREIFAQRTALIQQIGGSEMIHIFNVVLPTIGEVMDRADYDAPKATRH